MGRLGDIALDVGRNASVQTQPQPANIIEFVESKWGLNLKLFPVQRVILKAHYGIALDDTIKFKISDWRKIHFKEYTEVTYLKYLYDTKRCNISEVVPGVERRELVLAIGRRSGKTMLASIIVAYETYKLLLKESPQKYYGLPDAKMIQIVSVATDKDQAGLLYQDASAFFRGCEFFVPHSANHTQTYARFQTTWDVDKYGRYANDPTAKSSINITFRSCVAKGLRGPGNIVVILDEVAHFTDAGQSSAASVYNAITPSTATFSPKDPNNYEDSIGPGEGRILSISSPLGKQGHFYQLFEIGMKGGKASENFLCIQAPSWEVNPAVAASEFEKHFLKDPIVFFTEFGAEFTDRTRGWIEREEDLIVCIDKTRRPLVQAPSRRPHFIGIDLALVLDASAIAIGHLEDVGGESKIIVDLVDQIKAGEGDYKGEQRLDFDGVADWVQRLSRKFFIASGFCDQWAGIPFEQAMAKRGLSQITYEFLNKQKGSEIYKNFKDMMWASRLVLYDSPIPDGENHCGYIQELLELQAEYHSKYIVTVEAPKMKDKHDDRSDALVRMVWEASKKLESKKFIGNSYRDRYAQGGVEGDSSARYRRAFRKARQMGSSPDRQQARGNQNKIRGRF